MGQSGGGSAIFYLAIVNEIEWLKVIGTLFFIYFSGRHNDPILVIALYFKVALHRNVFYKRHEIIT